MPQSLFLPQLHDFTQISHPLRTPSWEISKASTVSRFPDSVTSRSKIPCSTPAHAKVQLSRAPRKHGCLHLLSCPVLPPGCDQVNATPRVPGSALKTLRLPGVGNSWQGVLRPYSPGARLNSSPSLTSGMRVNEICSSPCFPFFLPLKLVLLHTPDSEPNSCSLLAASPNGSSTHGWHSKSS